MVREDPIRTEADQREQQRLKREEQRQVCELRKSIALRNAKLALWREQEAERKAFAKAAERSAAVAEEDSSGSDATEPDSFRP